MTSLRRFSSAPLTSTVLAVLLVFSPLAVAREADAGTADQVRVLQGIPAIARAFAPIAGVNWQDFANVLAGICAVESKCDPTYPHYVNGGKYSQYQGLFQMNEYEVSKAESALQGMLPQMQAAAGSSPEQQKAFEFVKKAIEAARSSGGDRRFHPEYGVILGAAKHIQINAQLARQYPGDPLHQAAGHMTAQFSGITEAKIRAGQFSAAIGGNPFDARTEAGALAVNQVSGGSTVAAAIEVAGTRYGTTMRAMMQRMSQVTNGLTSIPDTVQPFNAPPYQPGTAPMLGTSYSGVSTLMETGQIKPIAAPAYQATTPPQTTNIGATSTPAQPTQTGTQNGVSGGGYVPPALLLIAQPARVKRGDPIVVSWTSVGMRSDTPCTAMQQGGTAFGDSNEGTKIIPTGPASIGTLSYTLSCTTISGDTKQSSASVEVY